ncbi:MAG: hypothetical protein ACE5EQ_11270 [Phycisphaerae bacterium]
MTIDLSQQDRSLLVNLLEHELRELPSEVRRTQTSRYRDELKTQERDLRSLLHRLKKPVEA